jgi:hypothetical protein
VARKGEACHSGPAGRHHQPAIARPGCRPALRHQHTSPSTPALARALPRAPSLDVALSFDFVRAVGRGRPEPRAEVTRPVCEHVRLYFEMSGGLRCAAGSRTCSLTRGVDAGVCHGSRCSRASPRIEGISQPAHHFLTRRANPHWEVGEPSFDPGDVVAFASWRTSNGLLTPRTPRPSTCV